ncbi:MAG: DNA polymerase III subunit delta [Elusimicrobia bacterium CG1_02_37_114]|nr:MAG: DNA polymerase III subunit delta [Elusimicrobia bacterium CG1_02_37_114]PIV52453.1 MAG: DNA polymerase III subunit delta [Elusimicrobia bacterium CG02_land_8_20_14_3_00_37_13]
MGYIKHNEFDKQLSGQRTISFYYFWGGESVLQQNLLEKIQKNENLEKEILYGETLKVDQLVNAVSTATLFADKKLIVIKNAEKIKTKDEKNIAEVLGTSPTVNPLFFLCSEKISKDELRNNPLIRKIAELGEVVEFRQLYQNEMIEYIVHKVAGRGKTISRSDVQYFIDLTGNNLSEVKNELEKLFLYTKDKKIINSTDIENCSGYTNQQNLYKLNDAIRIKDKQKALKVLNELIESGENEIHIIRSVYKEFNKMLLAESYIEEKKFNSRKVIETMRLNKYYGEKFLAEIKKYSRSDIINKIEMLYLTELADKSGRIVNSDLHMLILGLRA